MENTRFDSTERYVATDDLKMAVNAAVTLERPILVKGEPGTGKTQLAQEVAASLSKDLIEWHIKSTTKAQQGLYEYDAVRGCATASSATTKCTTSATTLCAASYGKRSTMAASPCC